MMTGKTKPIPILGRELIFFNQRSREWTHPYAWQDQQENLSDAGCGIFSLAHAVEWLTGAVLCPEELADFAVEHGGRGDDGTDRPALLAALTEEGMAARFGFRYDGDGHRNDLPALHTMLLAGAGVAFCNLRVGHIVCLIAARETKRGVEVLAIDSYSESASDKVRDYVTEVVEGSEIVWPVRNADGLEVGTTVSYGAFWVDGLLPRDFNLLHRL